MKLNKSFVSACVGLVGLVQAYASEGSEMKSIAEEIFHYTSAGEPEVVLDTTGKLKFLGTRRMKIGGIDYRLSAIKMKDNNRSLVIEIFGKAEKDYEKFLDEGADGLLNWKINGGDVNFPNEQEHERYRIILEEIKNEIGREMAPKIKHPERLCRGCVFT